MLCIGIWSGHNCTAPSGFENFSLVLKTGAKTTTWCYIVPLLHCFSAMELVFSELHSTKAIGLPVILRGEWGFCGRNAQKYLITEWMNLLSDFYEDFRDFPVSEVSEIEQGLGWQKKLRGKTPHLLKKLFRKNWSGSQWLFSSYTIKCLQLLQLISEILTRIKWEHPPFSS